MYFQIKFADGSPGIGKIPHEVRDAYFAHPTIRSKSLMEVLENLRNNSSL